MVASEAVMYNPYEYSVVNILKGVISSVILLSQTAKSEAYNAPDTLTRELALSKAQAYDDCIQLLQANLPGNLNG